MNLKVSSMLHISYFLIGSFLSSSYLCIAQNSGGCFTKFQLIKLQKSSLNDISRFLNTEGWSFDGTKSNQSFHYINDSINYNIVQWKKSNYYNSSNLLFCNLKDKPNIIIYQASSDCFHDLMNAFSSTSAGITKVEEDILSTSFIEGGSTIEFREYRQDYSTKKYSIMINNSLALQNKITIRFLEKLINKIFLYPKQTEDKDDVPPIIYEEEHEVFVLTSEAPLTLVEQMPTFPGGEAEMMKYIQKNISYPQIEKEGQIQGTCYVTFVVEKDGSITDVKVLRGVSGGKGCDNEAMRVVKSMPSWKAGKQNGREVRVQYNLPIKFISR